MRSALVLLSLLGGVQGVVLAAALSFRPTNRRANRLLAALLLAMAAYLLVGAYHLGGYVSRWPWAFGWTHPLPLLFGPLVYLYARHAADGDRSLRAVDALHAMPAIFLLGWSLPVYLLPTSEKLALYAQMQARQIPEMLVQNLWASWWIKITSGAAYTVATIRVVRRHRRAMEQQYSSLRSVTLDWLLLLCAASAAAWGVVMLAGAAEPLRLVPSGTGDQLVAVVMTAAIFLLGYRGLQQPEIHVVEVSPSTNLPPANAPRAAMDSAPTPASPNTGGGERSSLTPGVVRALTDRLQQAMEQEQAWRDAELTLGSLAQIIGTTPHKLSELLNTQVGQSFHDYVNGFRVAEVQRRLRDPDDAHRAVLTLALDAGFASKSTFNAVFRRQTGVTPSAWREAHVPPGPPV
ncbi:MAG: AraC family transcriptional regulator [Gemmatimonadaceae bacterium]|nr:AraC family transcriptional regulator [Gemmatimonadaceae bacterium]